MFKLLKLIYLYKVIYWRNAESQKGTVSSLQHILIEFWIKTEIDFSSLESAVDFYDEDLSNKEVVQNDFMLLKKSVVKKNFKTSLKQPSVLTKNVTRLSSQYIFFCSLKKTSSLEVLPASVATVEINFSSLSRLKTYLRNSTSESRLIRLL